MNVNTRARLFDIEQAARVVLHVSSATVRRRISSGELEAYRVGAHGNIRVSERALASLLVPYELGGRVRGATVARPPKSSR